MPVRVIEGREKGGAAPMARPGDWKKKKERLFQAAPWERIEWDVGTSFYRNPKGSPASIEARNAIGVLFRGWLLVHDLISIIGLAYQDFNFPFYFSVL